MFVCSHLIGRMRATAELARRLGTDGSDIILLAPDVVRPYVATGTGRFHTIDALDMGGVSAGKRRSLADFWPTVRRQRLQDLEATLNIAAFAEIVTTEAPDLVVIDAEMHPHIVTALGMGCRVVLLSDLFLSPPSRAVPPLDSLLVPGRNSANDIGRAWVRLWLRWRYIQGTRWVKTAGADYLSLLRYMARRHGADWRHHTTRWWWQIPVAWRRLPLVILQGKPLDFPMEHPPNHIHVGPMLSATPPLSGQSDRSLAVAQDAKRTSKTLIYIGFGTSFTTPERIIRTVWRAIEACPDVVAIHAMAPRPDIDAQDAPKNVCLVDWAPQRHLLELCDAAIIHAGVNTVLECLAGGTPMLAIPRGIDQPGNAARIAYHGLGFACPPNARADDIQMQLRALLGDPAYRDRCRDMHLALSDYTRDKTAEHTFRRLIATTCTDPVTE